jgi:hypothetical protein
MNGRTYYEGIKFTSTILDNSARASLNVEDIDAISWSLGHVDDSGFGTGKLYVYLDEELKRTIDLDWRTTVTDFAFDVKDGTVLRLYYDVNGASAYALADIKADSREPELAHIVPRYGNAAELLNADFNNNDITVYNGESAKTNKFTMNEKEHTQGFFCKSTSVLGNSGNVAFNTENVDSIKFKYGHIDGSGDSKATLSVSKDGIEAEKMLLVSDMDTLEKSIDTSDAEYIYFYFNIDGSAAYAVADVEFVPASSAPTTTTTAAKTTTTAKTTTKATTTTTTTAKATTKSTTTTTTTAKTTTKAATTTTTTAKTTTKAATTTTTTAKTTAKATTTTTTTTTTAKTTTTAESIVPSNEKLLENGDMNNDGKVDSIDAALLVKKLVSEDQGYEPADGKGDFNGDGKVAVNDMMFILKYYSLFSLSETGPDNAYKYLTSIKELPAYNGKKVAVSQDVAEFWTNDEYMEIFVNFNADATIYELSGQILFNGKTPSEAGLTDVELDFTGKKLSQDVDAKTGKFIVYGGKDNSIGMIFRMNIGKAGDYVISYPELKFYDDQGVEYSGYTRERLYPLLVIKEGEMQRKALGDFDGNGILDAVDASKILGSYAKYSTGLAVPTDEDKAVCDVNRDGFIDSVDASKVLAFYAYISTGGKDSFEKFLSR